MTDPQKIAQDPDVAALLALNDDPDYVKTVNCYGFALGVTLQEMRSVRLNWRPFVGSLSKCFRQNAVIAALPRRNQLIYQLLADGLEPIEPHEADTTEGHIIAAADYHFYRRVRPGLWIHKMGRNKISADEGDQPAITDINRALVYYANNAGGPLLGFYRVPENRLRLGAERPPVYSVVTANKLAYQLDICMTFALDTPDEAGTYDLLQQEIASLGLEAAMADKIEMWDYYRSPTAAASRRKFLGDTRPWAKPHR